MKAFIFAAGLGERLKPITHTIPKPLVPVLNRPAIEWALALVKKAGIKRIICNLHHLPHRIEEFFDHYSHMFNVTFSHEEVILGTGGGLKKCEHLIGDDEFLLINSDVVLDLDVEKLLQFHRNQKSIATVVLYKHPDAAIIGKVAVCNGKVCDFKNYLKTNLDSEYIYTGVAVLMPEIFKYLQHQHSSIVYTGYIELIKRKALAFFVHNGYWYDIGTPEELLKANINMISKISAAEELLSQLRVTIELVSKTAIVHPDAVIENSVIGEFAQIQKGASVINSVILPFSVVETNRKVKNKVMYKSSLI